MKTVKQISITLLLIFTNIILFAQNDSMPKYYNSDPTIAYLKTAKFKIGTGVLIPQNGLKEYFGISPIIELRIEFPLKQNKSLEFSVQTIVPNQEESFRYIRDLDTINAKATLMINPILRFKKYFIKTKKSDLNLNVGFGISVIQTNARNLFYEGKEGQKKYETITAFLASPGIEYSYKFNNEELSVGFNVQYAPYKIEGSLRENLGTIFYTPKIAYKF